MGVTYTKPSLQVRGVRVGMVKAVPDYTYTPFPAHRTKSSGACTASFKALPSSKVTDTELFWWTDCHFVSNNDSELFVTCGAYHLRPSQSPVKEPKVPHGKICRFNLSQERIQCEYFGKPQTPALPKLNAFTNGETMAFIGAGDIKLLSLNTSHVESKALDLHFSNYRCLALAGNEAKFAIMARSSRYNYILYVYQVCTPTFPDVEFDLFKINKEFKRSSANNEHCECKWSTDSAYIAVSLTTGPLMVLNHRQRSLVCNVFPDVIPDACLGRETTFDFDPRSLHQILAIGTNDRRLYIINVDTGKILCQTETFCGSDSIDAVRYCPDGRFVGVALHDCHIQLYNPEDCTLMFRFSMKDGSPDLMEWSPGPCPAVVHLNFSSCGQHAVTSTSDGVVRLWQLPCNLHLQSLCKRAILQNVRQDRIKRLPLPDQIIDYLLSMPCRL